MRVRVSPWAPTIFKRIFMENEVKKPISNSNKNDQTQQKYETADKKARKWAEEQELKRDHDPMWDYDR